MERERSVSPRRETIDFLPPGRFTETERIYSVNVSSDEKFLLVNTSEKEPVRREGDYCCSRLNDGRSVLDGCYSRKCVCGT